VPPLFVSTSLETTVDGATASENRQTEAAADTIVSPHKETSMATVRMEIAVRGVPDGVWQAVRDFGAVHTKVAPGFLTELRMDKGDRVVTFFNGLVARERLVTVDDQACRLVYAVVEGRPQHYNAAVEVRPDADGSRIVWTIDVLPDDLAPAIQGMMGKAAEAMAKALA
jgi:hypothetical protein